MFSDPAGSARGAPRYLGGMLRDRRLAVRMVMPVVALLLAVACGGDEGGDAVGTDVPNVTVRDVGSGADLNLRALALADRPTLYWFWAPH